MKILGTRDGKWLCAAILLLGLIAVGILFVPRVTRHIFGRPESLITTPDTMIRSMALYRNGELLAAGGSILARRGWKRGSGTVYLWNARTGQQLSTIAPVYTHDRTNFIDGFDIYALTISSDAKQIGFSRAVANWTLYDTATQKELWQFPSFIEVAKFSQDGRFIALSSYNHIFIVNARDGKVRAQWKRISTSNSQDLAWSPDGAWVATIGPSKINSPIDLHRADNGKFVRRIISKQNMSGETLASVTFSSDNKHLLTASSVGTYDSKDTFDSFAPVRCYDATTGKLMWEVKAPAFGGTDGTHVAFCDAVFSPDGSVVAAYQYDEGRIFLLDSMTGAIKKTLSLGNAAHSTFYVPPGLAFSPDGKRLFARGKDAILFWDLK
jgi:WD40 repeat protein